MKTAGHKIFALLQILLAGIILAVAVGFAPPPSTINIAATRQRTASLLFANKESNYNDDAFGFIFLGGSAAAQDPIFGATFLALSVAAVIATKLQVLPDNKQVPAAVAGFTLLLVPVISAILPDAMFGMNMTPGDNARLIELAFCSVSMLYGFVVSSEQNTT